MSIVISFIPWIVYWVLVGNTAFTTAVTIAFALTVLNQLITRIRGGRVYTLDIGNLVVFAVLVVAAYTLPSDVLEKWLSALSNLGLFLIALVGLLLGKPFVREYASAQVDAETAKTGGFKTITLAMTWMWIGAYAIMTISSLVPPIVDGDATLLDMDDTLGIVCYWVIPYVALDVAGAVSATFPPWFEKRNAEVDTRTAGQTPLVPQPAPPSLHDSNLLGIFELSGDMGFYAAPVGPAALRALGRRLPPAVRPAWRAARLAARPAARPGPRCQLGENVSIVLTSYVAVTSNTFQFGGQVPAGGQRRGAPHHLYGRGLVRDQRAAGAQAVQDRRPAPRAGVSISAGDKELFGVDLCGPPRRPAALVRHRPGLVHVLRIRRRLRVRRRHAAGRRAPGDPRRRRRTWSRRWRPPTGVAGRPSRPTRGRAASIIADQLPEGLWVRPDQVVEVRQSVAPLNRTITAYGELVPAAAGSTPTDVTVGGSSSPRPSGSTTGSRRPSSTGSTTRRRLSSPSYELMTAGVRFGDDGDRHQHRPRRPSARRSAGQPEESIFPERRAKPLTATS